MLKKIATYLVFTCAAALLSTVMGGGEDARAYPTEQLTPINTLGAWSYQGMEPGIYGGNSNDMPAPLFNAAMIDASQIAPRNAQGAVVATGKIGFIEVGPSVLQMWAPTFNQIARGSGRLNPAVRLVNCAQSGHVANYWTQPGPTWSQCLNRIFSSGLSAKQVQAVLIENVTARQNLYGDFATRTAISAGHLQGTIAMARRYFPNLKIIYVNSFHTAQAAAPQRALPEPLAYEFGFAVRRVITQQDLSLPSSVVWAAYNWTNGVTPRADGLNIPGYFFYDGIHPNAQGISALSQYTWSTLVQNPTAQGWFIK